MAWAGGSVYTAIMYQSQVIFIFNITLLSGQLRN